MKRYLLPLLALLYFTSCSDSNTSLEQKLREAVTEGEVGANGYKTINLTELTDFEWDRLYYFQAGEDNKSISDAIGFKWEGAGVDEGYRRLLFVKGEEVVSYTDYNYSEFPLFVYGCQGDKWVYPISRSSFASFKYCNEDVEVYTFIPVPCVEDIRELMTYKCPAGTDVAE
ncbi:hypothetical protein [Pontibacter cellulosilyticus]|uniref:Uncharacterized protein n=1 Tax=Pontibacter cellulosilyticus TaxID=1720253 RepID=A0A923SIP7_9BACT|nr:hypothetical protein [Pontibacter cellulosilyticus]MBC5992827.1 hypothetical protein [Pontibacter cellulosilyticus]